MAKAKKKGSKRKNGEIQTSPNEYDEMGQTRNKDEVKLMRKKKNIISDNELGQIENKTKVFNH